MLRPRKKQKWQKNWFLKRNELLNVQVSTIVHADHCSQSYLPRRNNISTAGVILHRATDPLGSESKIARGAVRRRRHIHQALSNATKFPYLRLTYRRTAFSSLLPFLRFSSFLLSPPNRIREGVRQASYINHKRLTPFRKRTVACTWLR